MEEQTESHKDTPDEGTSIEKGTVLNEQSPFIPKVSPSPHRKHRVWIYVVIIVLLVAAGTGAWWYRQHHHKQQPIKKSTTIKTSQTEKSTTEANYVFYQSPTKLGNLNFFSDTTALFGTNCTNSSQTTNCPPTVTPDQISYAQIGLTPSKQPIIVAYDNNIGLGSFYYVAIETTPGRYAINGKLNNDLVTDQTAIKLMRSSISSNVTLDTTDTIAPLNFPSSISVNGTAFTIPPDFSGPVGYFIDGLDQIRGQYYGAVKSSQIVKIGSSGLMTYYEVTPESQPTYQVKEIYATVAGVFAGAYVPVDPLTSNNAPIIKWDDGSVNNNTYTSATQGCGSANGYVIDPNVDTSQLTAIGTGPNNQTIYELPTDNPLFTVYYQDNYGGGSELQDASLENLSASQFQNEHAIIVAQNALKEYVVYQRTDMFSGGGCGEPVVYLYPQKPTEVSVKVDANIASSAPAYGPNGWQDVFALPDGSLTYDGTPYSSLIWEGTGKGIYPLIDSGTVVPHSQVVATIKTQLHEQGLNNTEIAAFLEYWQPKLPTTPYTRLTWLNTAQMNNLAPLEITPKPTTVIRTFLDFQGLNKFIQIAPQTFSAPKRQGFTVVEWGGLIKGELH